MHDTIFKRMSWLTCCKRMTSAFFNILIAQNDPVAYVPVEMIVLLFIIKALRVVAYT